MKDKIKIDGGHGNCAEVIIDNSRTSLFFDFTTKHLHLNKKDEIKLMKYIANKCGYRVTKKLQ